IYLGALKIGLRGTLVCLRRFQAGPRLVHARLDLVTIEFREHLAGLHAVAGVYVKLLDDSAGLRLDINLRHRLDLAGRDDAFRQVTALHFAELFLRDLGAAARGGRNAEHEHEDRRDGNAAPQQATLFLLAVSVCHCLPPAQSTGKVTWRSSGTATRDGCFYASR